MLEVRWVCWSSEDLGPDYLGLLWKEDTNYATYLRKMSRIHRSTSEVGQWIATGDWACLCGLWATVPENAGGTHGAALCGGKRSDSSNDISHGWFRPLQGSFYHSGSFGPLKFWGLKSKQSQSLRFHYKLTKFYRDKRFLHYGNYVEMSFFANITKNKNSDI